MKKDYDQKIAEHYREVAEAEGLSSTSTMADEITRGLETAAIKAFVAESLRRLQAKHGRPATIIDVGCGNGYTLEVLAAAFPGNTFVGVEKSDNLRELAKTRFEQRKDVVILEGDIRDAGFAREHRADILLCQRVLINLLDIEDQRLALNNIIEIVAEGALLFIECFDSALAKLNEARGEFDLPSIGPAHHNLYLQDDFFDIPQLQPFERVADIPPANFLSTHYYVTRVLHPYMTENKPFKRNSEFVQFFSHALKQHVGDYSPLKLCVFEKRT